MAWSIAFAPGGGELIWTLEALRATVLRPLLDRPMLAATPAIAGSRLDALRRWLPIVLVVLGAGLRVAVWAGDRSFWIDEATVAIGLLWKPVTALWGTHDFGQISPPGWLALVRLAAVWGTDERILRLPSLLLAIGYLPAIWWLARRLAGERAALIALAMTAVSPALVSFAAELKPYGSDPLIAVVVMGAMIRVLDRPVLTTPAAIGFGFVVGLACWLSSAAILVVAGGLPAVVLARGWRPATADFGRRLLLAGVAGGLVAIVYLGHLRLEPWLHSYVSAFWDDRFLDPWNREFAHRLWRAPMALVSPTLFGHGGDLIPALLLIPIGFGVRWLVRHTNPPIAAIVIGPVPVLFVVAAFRIYPVAPRLALFLAPVITLFLAAGLVSLLDATRRRRWLPALLIALILLMPMAAAFELAVHPIDARGHARPALEAMARERRPEDVVYIFARGAPEWLFYTTDWRAPDRQRIAMVESRYRYPSGLTSASALPRGHAPEPIGDQLRRQYRGSTEVFGQFSGYVGKTGFYEHPGTDPGWAEAERERILRGNPQCVWLVVLHGAVIERDNLRAALGVAGYHHWVVHSASRSIVQRGCRAAATAAPPGGP